METQAYKILMLGAYAIYSFHMPMYMGLSGALFEHQKEYKKSFKIFIINKFKRLIVPYVIVTLLFSIPITIFTGCYDRDQSLIRYIVVDQLFGQGNTYLWFLQVLFAEFIVYYIIFRLININRVKIIGIFSVILICLSIYCAQITNIVALLNILRYALWFFLGIIFERKRNIINNKSSHRFLIQLLFVWIGLCLLTTLIPDNSKMFFVRELVKIVTSVSGILMVYVIANQLSVNNSRMRQNSLYKKLLRNSLGMYLYSNPINFFVISMLFNIFGVRIFINNIGTLIVFISRLILSFVGSIVITELLRKLNLKYIV